MQKSLLLCLLTLFFLSSSAQRYEWTRQMDSERFIFNYENQRDVIQDGKYIYVFKSFSGTITIGTTTLTAPNNRDAIYLAKYDTLNSLIWVKSGYSSNSSVEPISLEVGLNSDVFILFSSGGGTITWDNTSKTRKGSRGNSYLVKLDSTGSTSWIRGIFSPTRGVSRSSLYNTSFGDSLLFILGTAYPDDTIRFTGINDSLLPANSGTAWVAAFKSDGTIHYVKNIINGYPRHMILKAINDSAFYISLFAFGDIDIGSSISEPNLKQFCISKFSSPTTCDWFIKSNREVARYRTPILAIELANDGGIYFAGRQVIDDIIIQSDTLSKPLVTPWYLSDHWFFVGKISSAGNLALLKNYELDGKLYSMAKNSKEELLLTGYFEDSITVNGQTHYALGEEDMCFLNLDSNLNPNWFQQGGGYKTDEVTSVTSNASPSFYFLGNFEGLSEFGSTIYQSNLPKRSHLLGKMTDCKNPFIPLTINGDTNLCSGSDVRIAADISPPATFEWFKDSSSLSGEVFRDLTVNNSGSYYTIINRQGCNDTSRTVKVTVDSISSVALSLPTDTICSQDQIVNLTGGTPTGGFYFGKGVTDSIFNPPLANIGLNTIGYSRSNETCSDTAFSTILVRSSPSPEINGQSQVCENSTGISYTATSTGLSYNWQVSGGTIASGQGTRSISVNWGAQGDGIVTLSETNADSCTFSAIDTVDVDGQQIIGQIVGDSSACINSINYTYSIEAASLFYSWTVSGGIIKSGQGTSTIGVEWTRLGQASLAVRLFNTCGKDSTFYDTVMVNNTPISSYSGINNSCLTFNELSYKADSSGLNYLWKTDSSGTISYGQSTDSIRIDWTKAGKFDLTLIETNSFGCSDSSIQQIRIDSSTSLTLNQAICSGTSFNFSGNNISTQGLYYDTLINANGCDSIVKLNLEVIPLKKDSISAIICSNESFIFGGNSLNTSGNYIDTAVSVNGCDSIVYLNLAVLPAKNLNISDTICDGGSYSFAGNFLTTSGTYFDSLLTQEGCDSIIRLSFVVKSKASVNLTQTICSGDSLLFAGNYLKISGTFSDTTIGSNNCDSITSMDLTVLPTFSTTLNETICMGESFNFSGNNLTTTGSYKDTIPAINGCDSIINLNLTVLNRSNDTVLQSICFGESYSFGGQVLTVSGTYLDTLTNQNNCDSIIMLQLNVFPKISTALNSSICQGSSYSFGNRQLQQAGNYRDTLTSKSGCDSIISLSLSILPVARDSNTVSLCFGDTYQFAGKILNSSGVYSDTLNSTNNCDSISTLTLLISSPINDSVIVKSDSLIAMQSGVSYQWMQCDTSTGFYTNISGATNKYFVSNDSNYYAVKLFNTRCSDTSSCYQRNFITSIEDIEFESKLNIFPNPTRNVINIQARVKNNADKIKINVRTLTGKLIKYEEVNSGNKSFIHQMDFSGLAKGVYFIQLSFSNQQIIKKVILH